MRRTTVAVGLCLPMLALTVWPTQAKAPGATWCYRDVCHRVRTVGETQRLVGKTLTLEASFYDEPRLDRFNRGKHTSNGEVFDANNPARVAAANFPDGTELLLRNPENGRSSHVRVNDFGPFLRSRQLDVTRRVADDLDFARLGVTKLEVTVIAAPPPEEVVYRKNRISLPTRGYLGAVDETQIPVITRTLIAAAQESTPTVSATMPQGERPHVSASNLFTGYDLLGRVRAILGAQKAPAVAELERAVIASDAGVPDAGPAAGRDQSRPSQAPSHQIQTAASTQPSSHSPATTQTDLGRIATATQITIEDKPDRKTILPETALAAPMPAAPPVRMAATEAKLPELTLPDLPEPAAASTAPNSAKPSDIVQANLVPALSTEHNLHMAMFSETIPKGMMPMATELFGQALQAMQGWSALLGGNVPASQQYMLITLMAALASALLYSTWHARSGRPLAATPSMRSAADAQSPTPQSDAPVGTSAHVTPPAKAPSAPMPAPAQPTIRGSQIGSDITVIGDVTSTGTLTIAGLVRGRVKADTLIILEGGRIEGPVEARLVRNHGAIAGPITAHELHLAPTSSCHGQVAVTSLSVEFGAVLEADVSRRPAVG